MEPRLSLITLTVMTLPNIDCNQAEPYPVLPGGLLAGSLLLKPAAETTWGGFSGFDPDSDGHPWEVAWNPSFPLE